MAAVCFDLATAKKQKACKLHPGRLAFFVKMLKIIWKAVSLLWYAHGTGWNVTCEWHRTRQPSRQEMVNDFPGVTPTHQH
jgi:hypothetical protein